MAWEVNWLLRRFQSALQPVAACFKFLKQYLCTHTGEEQPLKYGLTRGHLRIDITLELVPFYRSKFRFYLLQIRLNTYTNTILQTTLYKYK